MAVRELACRYLDDGLIAAHHAAIPTDIAGSLAALIGSIRTSAHYPADAGSAEVRA
ncbi:MAG TPA: hypothetical protein H9837_00175 [Candidatus Brachybacterium merdigallinarum]|nr:hypothetical protein [Candidatus Brachybacterium merdigallinarum]